jgi:hypothetical protein
MNHQRIVEILEAYRPGEGLESDPEIRQALELATQDPELGEIRKEIQDFDEAFGNALNQVEAPADLQEKILQTARLRALSESAEPVSSGRNIIQWIHPATFGIAAAIVIMLALTFTFWTKPGLDQPDLAMAQDPISSAAHALYTSLNPSFSSKDGSKVKDYLRSRNGIVPASLPGDVVWDKAFACDVIEVDGRQVSIICFMAPDNSRSMHLFTFLRKEFPNIDVPSRPSVRRDGKSCCATWGDAEQVHVLYSDKGEENLRTILDI